MIKTILCVIALAVVSACSTTVSPAPGHTKVTVPGGITIENDTHNGYPPYGKPYRHCPPGHAKKGWC
jgi:hypothetical protein